MRSRYGAKDPEAQRLVSDLLRKAEEAQVFFSFAQMDLETDRETAMRLLSDATDRLRDLSRAFGRLGDFLDPSDEADEALRQDAEALVADTTDAAESVRRLASEPLQ